MIKKYPSHWVITELENAGKVTTGNPAPQEKQYFINGITPFVRVADLGQLRDSVYIKNTKDKLNEKINNKLKLYPKGSVLFTKSGMSLLLNQRAILDSNMYVVSHIGIVIPNQDISSEWIYYWFKTIDFKKYAHATTLPSLKISIIRKMNFPLPPQNEQNRIVEKIEELFSDLDNATEDLKKTRGQLKIYRQAVLKAAFEGKLTNGNRNWVYKKFKECLKFSQGIQIDVYLQDEKKEQNKIRFLRIIDFTQGNKPARYINKPSSKYIVNKEDVSLVRYGATTGFVCSGLEGAIADNLFKVIPDETISNKYLLYFLNSPFFQQIISIKVKGAAMPAISFGLINDFVLPIPLLKEQSDIVREIELRLSVCDKLEETVQQSLNKIEYLRQSILKKAFEGKLVSQDPNDETAEKLLERIKQEKEKL